MIKPAEASKIVDFFEAHYVPVAQGAAEEFAIIFGITQLAAACLPLLAKRYALFPDDWASYQDEYPADIWCGNADSFCRSVVDMIDLLEELERGR